MSRRNDVAILIRALGCTQVQVDRAMALNDQTARACTQAERAYKAAAEHGKMASDRLAKARAACKRLRQEKEEAWIETALARDERDALKAELEKAKADADVIDANAAMRDAANAEAEKWRGSSSHWKGMFDREREEKARLQTDNTRLQQLVEWRDAEIKKLKAESGAVSPDALRRAVELAVSVGAEWVNGPAHGDADIQPAVLAALEPFEDGGWLRRRNQLADAILAHIVTAPASPWIPGPPKEWGGKDWILTVQRADGVGVVWHWNGSVAPPTLWKIIAHQPLPPAYVPPATEPGQ